MSIGFQLFKVNEKQLFILIYLTAIIIILQMITNKPKTKASTKKMSPIKSRNLLFGNIVVFD